MKQERLEEMIEDDLPARPRKNWIEPQALDPLSVEALHEYIAALRAEIARAEGAIEAKQSHRAAAENFFKR